jgi:hypothetical protein
LFSSYGLKAVEYTFYGIAALLFAFMCYVDSTQPEKPTDLLAVFFLLIGTGALLPRAIALSRWKRVVASVSSYRRDFDGDRTASYIYTFENERHTGSFGSTYGSQTLSSLEICVNPKAPWVRYPIFSNIWLFGFTMLGLGIFFLFVDLNH